MSGVAPSSRDSATTVLTTADSDCTSAPSVADKTLDQVYSQRAEAWMLAMALARRAGFEVGVREPGDWPVHVIVLPGLGEVALHVKAADALPSILEHATERTYDGHTNEDKSCRIRQFCNLEFGRDYSSFDSHNVASVQRLFDAAADGEGVFFDWTREERDALFAVYARFRERRARQVVRASVLSAVENVTGQVPSLQFGISSDGLAGLFSIASAAKRIRAAYEAVHPWLRFEPTQTVLDVYRARAALGDYHIYSADEWLTCLGLVSYAHYESVVGDRDIQSRREHLATTTEAIETFISFVRKWYPSKIIMIADFDLPRFGAFAESDGFTQSGDGWLRLRDGDFLSEASNITSYLLRRSMLALRVEMLDGLKFSIRCNVPGRPKLFRGDGCEDFELGRVSELLPELKPYAEEYGDLQTVYNYVPVGVIAKIAMDHGGLLDPATCRNLNDAIDRVQRLRCASAWIESRSSEKVGSLIEWLRSEGRGMSNFDVDID